jgi:hypothetical protein
MASRFRRAAVLGCSAASVCALGFVPLFFSDDGEGTWVDVGLAVVIVGSAALFFGPLVLQIREGLLSLRRDRPPLRWVLAVTVGFCGGATAVFFVAFLGLTIAEGSGAHWADLPSAAEFFGPWLYALISGAVVVGVIELVGRVGRRGTRPRQAPGA